MLSTIITIITSFYIALFTQRASQSASDIITPGHWALNHSFTISTPWGVYSLCDNYMRYSAKPRTISALNHRYPFTPGWREAVKVNEPTLTAEQKHQSLSSVLLSCASLVSIECLDKVQVNYQEPGLGEFKPLVENRFNAL